MSKVIGTDTERLILGLGKTGFSMASWLARQGRSFRVLDTRDDPPYLAAVRELCPQSHIHTGGWRQDWLDAADELYVSPGLALSQEPIRQALAKGAMLVSDIDLYRQHSQASVIAVTGSNGKSTVVRLLEHIAQTLGLQALAGGNIGRPVLDLLEEPHELAVLELSSFQLEMTHALNADVAMVLNISPDHMDRYPDMTAYRAAKHRIFTGCQAIVVHAEDPLTAPLVSEQMPRQAYSLKQADIGLLSLQTEPGGVRLYRGLEPVYLWSGLALKGRHNQLNILAALSAGMLQGWSLTAMAEAVGSYRGLPHRCEWVADQAGVTFINDSKGTNVGATLAALDGLAPECAGRMHLLAGGDGKAADFRALGETCQRLGVSVYSYGRDGEQIAQACRQAGSEWVWTEDTLLAALAQARIRSAPGDWVILSPACASFDQFADFEARGEAFRQAVLDRATGMGGAL